MIQLAWRWLMFQKHSALAQWFQERTASARRDVRKTMIVALARKLRSEERRVGKSVDLGGRRIIKKKKKRRRDGACSHREEEEIRYRSQLAALSREGQA